MHNIQFTISVQNNSNKIIGSSEEKFTGIRPGSWIKIGNDDITYTILDRGDTFYLKSFSVLDPKILCIDDNIGINLQNGDSIKIIYKEYELLMINEIIDSGVNYSEEDELVLNGGKLIVNIMNGITCPSILKVTEINNGKIRQLGIKEKGRYIETPNNPVSLSGGLGADSKVNLKFTECGDRTVLERTIININYKENKTYLNLNYSLPAGLKEGTLSTEKSYLILSSSYMGETATNMNYQIYKDFTPNLRLPLMVKNSLSPEVIHNKSMMIIETELNKIKEKLGIN